MVNRKSVAALVGVCGLAASALASIPPTDIYIAPGTSAPLGALGDGTEIFLLANNADNPMIDDNQNILVIAPVGGAAVTTANDRVLWYIDGGTPRPIAREGTQAFGMPSGAFYGIVNSSPRISGNGRIMFSSTMIPETGNTTTGLVTTGAVGRNDSAIWVTDVSGGAKSVLVRRGDDADAGTFLPAGVFHDTAFALSQQGTSLNNNGLAFFQGTLGGTGVVTANNQAFFLGAVGSVNALPLRKGDGVALDSSNPGVDPNPTVGAFGFNMQINASGQAFFDTT